MSHNAISSKSNLEEMRKRNAEKRKVMKSVQYDAKMENEFFSVVKNSVYRLITEEERNGSKAR